MNEFNAVEILYHVFLLTAIGHCFGVTIDYMYTFLTNDSLINLQIKIEKEGN